MTESLKCNNATRRHKTINALGRFFFHLASNVVIVQRCSLFFHSASNVVIVVIALFALFSFSEQRCSPFFLVSNLVGFFEKSTLS